MYPESQRFQIPSKFQPFLLRRLFLQTPSFPGSSPTEHHSPRSARAAADSLSSPPSRSRAPKFPGVIGWLPGPARPSRPGSPRRPAVTVGREGVHPAPRPVQAGQRVGESGRLCAAPLDGGRAARRLHALGSRGARPPGSWACPVSPPWPPGEVPRRVLAARARGAGRRRSAALWSPREADLLCGMRDAGPGERRGYARGGRRRAEARGGRRAGPGLGPRLQGAPLSGGGRGTRANVGWGVRRGHQPPGPRVFGSRLDRWRARRLGMPRVDPVAWDSGANPTLGDGQKRLSLSQRPGENGNSVLRTSTNEVNRGAPSSDTHSSDRPSASSYHVIRASASPRGCARV